MIPAHLFWFSSATFLLDHHH